MYFTIDYQLFNDIRVGAACQGPSPSPPAPVSAVITISVLIMRQHAAAPPGYRGYMRLYEGSDRCGCEGG